MIEICPCCDNQGIELYNVIEGYNYYKCDACGSLFIDPALISQIDQGKNVVKYQEDYWAFELKSSRERAFGANLARLSEVIHYAKKDINIFLDIGSGSGYILDAVKYYIPCGVDKFFAIEKYPPPPNFRTLFDFMINRHRWYRTRTKCKNYFVGEICDFPYKVDAGMCIEVVEHLTPAMLKNFLAGIAEISNEGAVYIFNTGMPEYVINEDPQYLDPVKRGHIMSYSLAAIRHIAKEFGFNVYAIQGKTWAFVIEYSKDFDPNENICDRIWKISEHNRSILNDPKTGEVLRILGLESVRAYL